MYEQMCFFAEPQPTGQEVTEYGRLLAFEDLRPGMMVVEEMRTQSNTWYHVARVERIIWLPQDQDMRAVLTCGKRQPLINRRYIQSGAIRLFAIA